MALANLGPSDQRQAVLPAERNALNRAPMTIHIPTDPLTDFCAEIFARVGCRSEEAERISASLVDSNLTGHDSHGVIRVPRYVDWVRTGDLIPNQSIERLVDTPSSASSTPALASAR
jgi:LDH2 family malate/lactate/ureidoglycolate dehydrogenase